MSASRAVSITPAVLAVLLCFPGAALAQGTKQPVRIGVFDSRCVAIAYGRSSVFAETLKGMRADLAKAKQDGNADRVKELETLGPVLQVIMHQQGFSTGSVRNIMTTVADRLPPHRSQAPRFADRLEVGTLPP